MYESGTKGLIAGLELEIFKGSNFMASAQGHEKSLHAKGCLDVQDTNTNSKGKDAIRPFHKTRAPVQLRLPVTQKSTKSLKTLLVSHTKTFEMTKQTQPRIMQLIILK